MKKTILLTIFKNLLKYETKYEEQTLLKKKRNIINKQVMNKSIYKNVKNCLVT